jgi:hypothetical protein
MRVRVFSKYTLPHSTVRGPGEQANCEAEAKAVANSF